MSDRGRLVQRSATARLKLLLYAHSFAPNVGGAETLVMMLANGLSGRATITVATRTATGAQDDRRFPFTVVRRPSALALWKLVWAADVVHVAGPALLPMLMAHLLGKPLVVEHHGYQAICPNGLLWLQPAGAVCPSHYAAGRYSRCVACQKSAMGLLGALRSILLTWPRRALARHAWANVAVSAHVAARLDLPRTIVIRHGVPRPRSAGSVREVDVPTFGYVGRLVREKGLPVLLDAAAKLARESRRFNLLMVGDGPERGALARRAAELGLEAEFTGALEGDSLEAAARRIDVAVMPSVWEETAGLAAMEAMRRGTPLLASAIGGLAETVGRGGGVLVEPGSVEALAGAMRDLLEDPERRAALGEQARRRADTAFTLERMIEEHAHLWARAAAR